MQPDPRIFLPAIRREILRPDLFGKALEEGLSPILMMRAGEGLAQLALRHHGLPEILRRLRPRQLALLEAAVARFKEFGLSPPATVFDAVGSCASAVRSGEEDVRIYELLADGVSACIAALSAYRAPGFERGAVLGELCRSASGLELEMRTAYVAALSAIKLEIERDRVDVTPPAPEPTDQLLTAILKQRFPGFPRIAARQVRRLPGVNAQEIFFFELAEHPEWAGPMVLRRASTFNATRASLADEFDLLRDLHELGLPVPRVLLVERDKGRLGGECLMMERLPGKPRPPEGLGPDGKALALAAAKVLAQIHRVDARRLSAPYRDDGRPVAERMQFLIDRFYARWRAERLEGSMSLESAFAWLRASTDRLDDGVSLVHGDCNFRNILVDGSGISALLDWELAHAGHRAEDLAYIKPDIEKILPWSEFLAAYVAAGGKPASEQAMRYFTVWSDVWRTSMAACVYAAYVRGEHRNFVFATVAFHEYYVTLDSLSAFMVNEAFGG